MEVGRLTLAFESQLEVERWGRTGEADGPRPDEARIPSRHVSARSRGRNTWTCHYLFRQCPEPLPRTPLSAQSRTSAHDLHHAGRLWGGGTRAGHKSKWPQNRRGKRLPNHHVSTRPRGRKTGLAMIFFDSVQSSSLMTWWKAFHQAPEFAAHSHAQGVHGHAPRRPAVGRWIHGQGERAGHMGRLPRPDDRGKTM